MNLSILGLDLLVLAQPRWLMLALLLLIAAVIDAWQWRIPNALTFGGSLAALGSSLLEPGSAGQAVLTVLAGLSVGMLLMLPLYLIRALGAGDVKLMGMVGAFLGVPHAVGATLLVFITGGVLALLLTLYRNGWQPLMARLLPLGSPSEGLGRMPYGASIGLGTLIYVCAFAPTAAGGSRWPGV
jgi:prepilin peptidase CpaA